MKKEEIQRIRHKYIPVDLQTSHGVTPMKTTWQQWLHRIATTILAILQALQIGGTI